MSGRGIHLDPSLWIASMVVCSALAFAQGDQEFSKVQIRVTGVSGNVLTQGGTL